MYIPIFTEQILVNSTRWPLMIDPQLQGIKWIKNKYGDDLKVVRLGQKSYLDIIEHSISEGFTVSNCSTIKSFTVFILKKESKLWSYLKNFRY